MDKSGVSKSAVTVWRPLRYVKSLKANDGVLTLVELKPKTGRYHQLRRHMVNQQVFTKEQRGGVFLSFYTVV